MSQVLIVSDSKSNTKLISSELMKRYDFEVIIKESADEAISFLEILGEVDLIISFEMLKGEFSAGKICEFLNNNQELFPIAMPVMIVGKLQIEYPKKHEIITQAKLEDIVKYAGYILGKEKSFIQPVFVIEEPKEEKVQEKTTVFRLPSKEILNQLESQGGNISNQEFNAQLVSMLVDYYGVLSCDLYIKKNQSDEYEVRFPKGVKIEKTDFEKLKIKGIRHLYSKNIENTNYLNDTNLHFLNKMKSLGGDVEVSLSLGAISYDILLDQIKSSKFDSFTIELIKLSLKNFDYLVKSEKSLQSFLQAVESKRFLYSFTHAFLTSYFMYLVFDKFSWSKDHSKNKLLYLSFFHDMALSNDKLIKKHHKFLATKSSFNEEEIKVVLNHGDQMAIILEKIIKAPKELIALIREHHGSFNGIGISETLNPKVYPLSKMFMVMEYLVTYYLDIMEKKNTPGNLLTPEQYNIFVNEVNTKYSKFNYLEVLPFINDIIKPVIVKNP